jgi:hypothetical protein
MMQPDGGRRHPHEALLNRDGAELLAELRSANFCGPLMEVVTDELWLHGWDVLRGLVRKGTVVRVPTGVPHQALTPQDRQTLHDSSEQRELLVLDALEWAVPKFVSYLREGRWSPEKGASIKTYFIGTCVSGFWRAYRPWHDERIRRLRAHTRLESMPLAPEETEFAEVAAQRGALRRIVREASPEQRLICFGILDDKTQSEIGDGLGLTARGVEGRLYQLRSKAWGLVKRGEVDPSLVPGSRAAARASRGAA